MQYYSLLNEPEAIHVGFQDNTKIYLREGYFNEKVFVKKGSKEYNNLVDILDGNYAKVFSKGQSEYSYLSSLLSLLRKEGLV